MAGKATSQYEDLLRHVLDNGTAKSDRTGTGTRSVFGDQIRFNLADGFPLVTTKFMSMGRITTELLWFLRGDSNIKYLHDHKNHIWDEWATSDGELGPVYGVQWRSWPTIDGGYIDQIANAVDQLRTNPNSRRIVVSAWNVADLPKMALEPCHAFFQFYVADGKLSCKLTQRSCDMFLGVPFNIASYALLTHMMAQQSGLQVGDLIWSGGDCHIYNNHIAQVELLLSREPFPFPTLELRKAESIFDYEPEDVVIRDYQHHPSIKAQIAV